MRGALVRPFCSVILFRRCFLAAALCLTGSGILLAQTQSVEQALPEPSAQWQSALEDLAGKISGFVPIHAEVECTLNNISSIPPADAAAIAAVFRSVLANRSLRAAQGGSADASLLLTLSEGVDGYVLVAQLHRSQGEHVAIVTVPRVAKTMSRSGGILLDVKRIWQQPPQILDFVLPQSEPGSQTILAVLEPDRLAFYSQGIAAWQFVRELPRASSWASRDWRGHIVASPPGAFAQGSTTWDVRWPRNECTGNLAQPSSVTCQSTDQTGDAWIEADARAPFIAPNTGDAVLLALRCDTRSIALATGAGDWTQPDSIQAYEISNGAGENAEASGSPIDFAGPVTAIWPGSAPATARAVVHNLQSGDYEAYVITATCSR